MPDNTNFWWPSREQLREYKERYEAIKSMQTYDSVTRCNSIIEAAYELGIHMVVNHLSVRALKNTESFLREGSDPLLAKYAKDAAVLRLFRAFSQYEIYPIYNKTLKLAAIRKELLKKLEVKLAQKGDELKRKRELAITRAAQRTAQAVCDNVIAAVRAARLQAARETICLALRPWMLAKLRICRAKAQGLQLAIRRNRENAARKARPVRE